MPATEPSIPLARAIEDLRAELLTALREGAGQTLQFRLKPIELQLTLGVTKTGEGKGGVKFWVLELGGGGSLENKVTHSLKLVLEPVGKNDEEIKVSSLRKQSSDDE